MEEFRRKAAEQATSYLRDGMVIGLGTGRTASFAVRKIGSMVEAGMHFIAIPTSESTAKLASSLGIELSTLDEHPDIDVTIDGADEVDPALNLIKGKGGALLREKIIASWTREEIIVVDEAKLVGRLGERESIPVEVLTFGYRHTLRLLSGLGSEAGIRMSGNVPFVTDNGNYIADCRFRAIDDLKSLQSTINVQPGVVENGLFLGMASRVIVGGASGIKVMESGPSQR